MQPSAQERPRSGGILRAFVDSATSLASRWRTSSSSLPPDSGLAELSRAPHISRLQVPGTRGRTDGGQPLAAVPERRLPLLQRPQSVALVDDDPDFLDLLASSLPWEWHVESFASARAFVNHLQQEPPRRERDYWLQQEIINGWRAGKPLVPQILDYWRSQPDRFALTGLAICDYGMPGQDGLQALAELGDWPGARVLLTGSEDPALATEAFNRRLIDQFIPKSSLNLQGLLEVLRRLGRRIDERSQQLWAGTLGREQAQLLTEPGVGEDLRAFAEKTWLEWVCIGEPFGILGLDFWGAASWLQLQPAAGLEQAAQAAAQAGADASALEEIRAGRSLPDLALLRSLGEPDSAMTVLPAFSIGRDGLLLGAFRRLPPRRGARAMPSYRDWLRKQKVRQGKL